MMASGFTCELYEPQLQEAPEYPNGDRFSPWNSPYSHVDCFQVPIFPKKYYLPNWSLTINEPLIADWRSKQYDPQRSGQLVVSGNFLYSFIYDSNHPEQQELSDHKSKDFSFFFIMGLKILLESGQNLSFQINILISLFLKRRIVVSPPFRERWKLFGCIKIKMMSQNLSLVIVLVLFLPIPFDVFLRKSSALSWLMLGKIMFEAL